MATTSTTNLALTKVTAGTGETFDAGADLWPNFDTLDHAIGASGSSGVGSAIANTTTETTIQTLTIAAGDAAAGSVWRLCAWGSASSTGTPTLTFRSRIGWVNAGTPGTLVTSNNPTLSAVSGVFWRVEMDLVCVTAGASATWLGDLQLDGNTGIADAIAAANATVGPQSSAVAVTWALTVAWSAASASNTTTRYGSWAAKVTSA